MTEFPTFNSLVQAEADARARARVNGASPQAFVAVKDDGKFAVVPRHIAPGYGVEIGVPEFSDGDRVRDMTFTGRQGRVVTANLRRCVVQWDHKDKGCTDVVPNFYLEPLPRRERVRLRRE